MKIINSNSDVSLQELINSLLERVPVGDADELHSALILLAGIVKRQQKEIESLKKVVREQVNIHA